MQSSHEEALLLISQAKDLVQIGHRRMVGAMRSIPDEKLNWSPAPTCRSAMQITGHVCGVSERLAAAFQGQTEGDSHDAAGREENVSERDQAMQWLEDSTAAVLTGLEHLTPERISADLPTPFGVMPMRRVMMIAGLHFIDHVGQLDYLQTLWGDLEMHF